MDLRYRSNIAMFIFYIKTYLNDITKQTHGEKVLLFHSSIRLVEDTLLQKVTSRQIRTLCIGEAGSGKTTLAKRLSYLWAQNWPCYKDIKALLFITPAEEDRDFEKTIRNAIPGKKASKDSVMGLLEEEPESVLLIIEAFEDFRNETVIREICQKIKDRCVNVLMTVRENHARLKQEFLSHFNLHIRVNGFTPNDGKHYAENFLKELKCTFPVQSFIDAVQEKPRIETNPLNLMLACQLYSEGELKPTDLDTLTEVSLFSMRASRMVERECEKRQICEELATGEVQKIQKIALYCMFRNTFRCTKSDFQALQIEIDSPGMVLLQMEKVFTAKDGNQVYYSWPHSRLFEFDAAMALAGIENFEYSQWLYWIANNPEFNSVAELLVAILGNGTRFDEVKTLTTASLLLQTKAHCSANIDTAIDCTHPCGWISEVKKKITLTEDNLPNTISQLQHIAVDQPDLSFINKCMGSVFQENTGLFKHLQLCYELGLKEDIHKGYIDALHNLCLPAIDR